MARNSSHNASTLNSTAPIPSATDRKMSRGRRRKHPRTDHPSNSPTAGSAKEIIQASGAQGSSCRSTSSDGDLKGDVSDANASEADEEEDDDGDGDVRAPSGRATEERGDQAGHLITEGDKQTACKRNQSTQISSTGRPGIPSQALIRTERSRRNITTQSKDCDSGDDAYNGVDDISDSDEGEPDVEKVEEKNIIESEEHGPTSKLSPTISGALSETSDTWEGFDIDGGLFLSDIPYFDDQYGRTDQGILDSEIELFQNTSVFEGFDSMPLLPQLPLPPARRVRFREPVMPPSDSSDIFSNDEDLNGLFSSNTEAQAEAAELSSFGAHANDENDEDNSSGGNSSGYETDTGDTTEEEDVPAFATTRPQALLRQPSLSSLDIGTKAAQVIQPAGSSTAQSPFKVPTTPTRNRLGPRLGSFKRNPSKPFAMVDCTGDNIVITPAKRPARAGGSFSKAASTRTSTANASPVLSQSTLASMLNDSEVNYSDYSSQVPADPMLAAGSESMADILLPVGPTTQRQENSDLAASVFYPMDGMGDVDALYPADDQDDDDNDLEDQLDVADFIDFGVDSSEDEDEVLDTVLPTPSSTSPTGASAHIHPKTSSPNNSSTNDLLAHFDKGVIGAFRQGQHQHQHQHQSHRPHNGLSLNRHAFKSGRQAPANSPASPPKKRKMSGGFAPSGSFGPFAKRRLMHHR